MAYRTKKKKNEKQNNLSETFQEISFSGGIVLSDLGNFDLWPRGNIP